MENLNYFIKKRTEAIKNLLEARTNYEAVVRNYKKDKEMIAEYLEKLERTQAVAQIYEDIVNLIEGEKELAQVIASKITNN